MRNINKKISKIYVVPDWYKNSQNVWYLPNKYLSSGLGNNAFSLNKKPDRRALKITPLKVGHMDDLRVGAEIVFQDFDENGNWVECVGLESAILCLDYPVPIYIFDNHNHVFYAWAEALKNGWIEKGGVLLHMDAHFDEGLPPFPIPTGMEELKQVWVYTNEVLQIATYIKPALDLGIFCECVKYVESSRFSVKGSELRDGDSGVINLDLDLFSDEMKHISWEQKIAVLKHYLPMAKLLTIATSPHFMGQEKAIEICKKLVNELFQLEPYCF